MEILTENNKIMEEKEMERNEMVTERNKGIKRMLNKVLSRKENGDATLVVAVIMIIIALILCFLFKDEITDMIQTAFTNLDTKLTTLLGTI